MRSERLHSIDIAKGILISILVLHHIFEFPSAWYDVNTSLISICRRLQQPLFLSWFMPSFFVITGMCSNFDSKWNTFLLKQVKTLLLPNILFTCYLYGIDQDWESIMLVLLKYGGEMWFLVALFSSKLCYYGLKHCVKSEAAILAIFVLLSFVAVLLKNEIDYFNYWWHRHTMVLAVFLAFGQWLKHNIESIHSIYCVVVYILTIVCVYLLGMDIPYVTVNFNVLLSNWLFFLLLASAGAVLLLKICSKINENSFFEYLGKNSLVIYMWQSELILWLLGYTLQYVSSESFLRFCLSCIVIWTLTIVVACAIGKLMNTKYLKWTLGKF